MRNTRNITWPQVFCFVGSDWSMAVKVGLQYRGGSPGIDIRRRASALARLAAAALGERRREPLVDEFEFTAQLSYSRCRYFAGHRAAFTFLAMLVKRQTGDDQPHAASVEQRRNPLPKAVPGFSRHDSHG